MKVEEGGALYNEFLKSIAYGFPTCTKIYKSVQLMHFCQLNHGMNKKSFNWLKQRIYHLSTRDPVQVNIFAKVSEDGESTNILIKSHGFVCGDYVSNILQSFLFIQDVDAMNECNNHFNFLKTTLCYEYQEEDGFDCIEFLKEKGPLSWINVQEHVRAANVNSVAILQKTEVLQTPNVIKTVKLSKEKDLVVRALMNCVPHNVIDVFVADPSL